MEERETSDLNPFRLSNAPARSFSLSSCKQKLSIRLHPTLFYFHSMDAQLKAVLLMTYANTAASEAVPIKSLYEVLLKYPGWTNAGQIIAPGVWPVGAVNRTKYPEQAYQLGRKI